MKVDTFNVNYIINGKITAIPTKMIYQQVAEDEFPQITLEVQVNNKHIQSKTSTTAEYAVKNLQKELPDNIVIACCQSCQHGNFNPFGDEENEIFCLEDLTIHNQEDVIKVFSEHDTNLRVRSRRLLDYCKNYKPISESEKYTYNDWGLEE